MRNNRDISRSTANGYRLNASRFHHHQIEKLTSRHKKRSHTHGKMGETGSRSTTNGPVYHALDDMIAEDHPVHLFDEVLARMHWSDWDAKHSNIEGRPPIHQKKPRLTRAALMYDPQKDVYFCPMGRKLEFWRQCSESRGCGRNVNIRVYR